MKSIRRSTVFMLLSAVLLAACASSTATPTIQVKEVWARPGLAGGNSAIYAIIDNSGPADTLLSAEVASADMVELHQSSMGDDGVMTMQMQHNIPIAEKSQTHLEPGGLHIMLMGLKADLNTGDILEVKLNFENAGAITIQAPVKDQAQ